MAIITVPHGELTGDQSAGPLSPALLLVVELLPPQR